MRDRIYIFLNGNPKVKKFVHFCLVTSNRSRPRWWVRFFLMPFLIKKEKGSYISCSVRRDLFPFNHFILGEKSIIEKDVTLNNGMGSIKIGDNCIIGIGSVILGEIVIGNNVGTGQYCVFTGLNHNYESITKPFNQQGTYTDPVVIEDDVVTGSHVVILPGVKIGTHSIIAAGSVVSRSVPPYSYVAGNPATVMFNLKTGKKVHK